MYIETEWVNKNKNSRGCATFPGLCACTVLRLALPEDAVPLTALLKHTHTHTQIGWEKPSMTWPKKGASSEEAPVLPRPLLLRLSDPSHIRWLPGLRQLLLPEAWLSLGSTGPSSSCCHHAYWSWELCCFLVSQWTANWWVFGPNWWSFSSVESQTLTFANTQAHAHKQTHSDCEIVWFPCLHVYI